MVLGGYVYYIFFFIQKLHHQGPGEKLLNSYVITKVLGPISIKFWLTSAERVNPEIVHPDIAIFPSLRCEARVSMLIFTRNFNL